MDKVVHFEIPYDDKERAMKFYKDNFGWGMNDLGPQMGDYVLAQAAAMDKDMMVQDNGAINGALAKRNNTDAVPRVYIQVASIEEAMEKIESSGGKSLREPMPIPHGRMSTFTDSEGNVVGLVDYSK